MYYYWNTKKSHSDNSETMTDFLENHLESNFEVIENEGTFSVIIDKNTGDFFEVHASGAGDFKTHKVEFIKISRK